MHEFMSWIRRNFQAVLLVGLGVCFAGDGILHWNDPPREVRTRGFYAIARRQFVDVGMGVLFIVAGIVGLRKT